MSPRLLRDWKRWWRGVNPKEKGKTTGWIGYTLVGQIEGLMTSIVETGIHLFTTEGMM